MISLYFSFFSIVSVACALGVLASKHPITGAVNLVVLMISLAGLYGILAGPFLGIVQILVYAGAIMMLVVFVIMVLGSARDRNRNPSGWLGLGAVVIAGIFAFLIYDQVRIVDVVPHPEAVDGTIAQLAKAMFDFSEQGRGWYILFEIIGLVLLVALAGAVMLSKRELNSRPEAVIEEESH